MAKEGGFTQTNLDNQGFGDLDNQTKSRYAWPLRFTPGVGTLLIVIGLLLRSPIWLGSMAVVAASGVLFPSGMLIDLVYNYGVRHLLRAPALPPTPTPRRFSYLLSSSLLTGSALAFIYDLPIVGFILGGFVVAGGTMLTASLWCLGSWLYHKIFQPKLICSFFLRISIFSLL